MKKVAAYMRVGNKEQLELTEQQQIEAMQRIADKMQGTVTPRTRPIPTPEELKATDQMEWIGRMNNIINAIEEIIFSEIVYR